MKLLGYSWIGVKQTVESMQTLHSLQTWYIIETHKHNTTLSTRIENIRIHENFSTIYTSFNNSQMIDKMAQNSLKWKGPTGLLFFLCILQENMVRIVETSIWLCLVFRRHLTGTKVVPQLGHLHNNLKKMKPKKIYGKLQNHILLFTHTLSLFWQISPPWQPFSATWQNQYTKSYFEIVQLWEQRYKDLSNHVM